MVKVALVTVLFNSDNVLEGFLKSISNQTFKDYHLFLIDNTSNAGTVKLLEDLTARFPVSGYTHIQNSKNAGVAKGNNQGIKLSLAGGFSHTILLNNDIEFEQRYLLEEIVNRTANQGESLVIPKIYFFDSLRIWMAGGRFNHTRGTVAHVGEHDNDGPANSTSAYFEYAPTCFMLINNNVFKDIGLMDEKYFVYYDDVDFLYRAKKKGYKILLMADLKVYHKVSSSTGGNESLFTIYYFTRNRIYFLRKNFRNLKYLVPMTFTLLTRIVKWFLYNKDQNREMIRGLKDGFSM